MLRSHPLPTHSTIARNPPRHPSLAQSQPRAPSASDTPPWGLLAHEGRSVQFDADVFVYDSGRKTNDLDFITDFRPGMDKIDLSRTDKFAGADFDELLAAANQIGADTVIDMGYGTLTLEGVDVEDLEADDFIF
jgi:peptidase M10/serralysin-like protein